MALHTWRQTILTLDKGNVIASANVPGVESKIIDILVPRNLAYRFKFGTPIILWLYTRETFTGSGSGGQTIALAQDLLDSPSLPSVSGDVYVFDQVTGAQLENYTVDHATNEITTTGGGFAANNIDVLYIWKSVTQKDIVLMKTSDAAQENFAPILRRPLENWHSVNQYSGKERQELRNEIVLPEKTHLLMFLNSDVLADFAANSPAYLELKVFQTPMNQVDPSMFSGLTDA